LIPREEHPALCEWVLATRILWNQGRLDAARKKQLLDFDIDLSSESNITENGGGNAVGNQNGLNMKKTPHHQRSKDKTKKANQKQSPRLQRPALPTRARQTSADPATMLLPSAGNAVDLKIGIANVGVMNVQDNDTNQQPVAVVCPGTAPRTTNISRSVGPESGNNASGAFSHAAAEAYMRESIKEALLVRTSPSEHLGIHTTEATHKQDELATHLRKNAMYSDDDLSLLMPTDESKAMMVSLGGAHPGPGQRRQHVAATVLRPVVTPSPSQEATPPALKTPLPQDNPRIYNIKYQGRKRSNAEEEERSFAAACRALLVEKHRKRLKSQQ
jgi:hypothetical protein